MTGATEEQCALRPEIGHVLFIDIVGYSKLLIDQQSEYLRELNEVVSGTKQFRESDAAGKLGSGDRFELRARALGARASLRREGID
jgi:hypothetical protein